VTWKPSEDHDQEIRRWMEKKGWPVTRIHYDADREVYGWRHELRGGKSPTLRISRYVLEHYPAWAVSHFLDELGLGREIRKRPQARLVIVQTGDRVTLEEVLP
jgi:hypothetical protein